MDVKYVTPFIEAFNNVMSQLGFAEIKKGNLQARKKTFTGEGVIIIVGIVGQLKGNVVYVMGTNSAKQVASTMMMGMPIDELDAMAKSALSELTNMLTANAATAFSAMDILIDISTPTFLQGESVEVTMSSDKVLCVQLLADGTPIDINISFEG